MLLWFSMCLMSETKERKSTEGMDGREGKMSSHGVAWIKVSQKPEAVRSGIRPMYPFSMLPPMRIRECVAFTAPVAFSF